MSRLRASRLFEIPCRGGYLGVKYYFIEDESPVALRQIPHSLQFLESLEW